MSEKHAERTIERIAEHLDKTSRGDLATELMEATRALLDGYRAAVASKTCDGCMEKGKWENELEHGCPCPCIRCVRRCHDNYMRGPEPGGEVEG